MSTNLQLNANQDASTTLSTANQMVTSSAGTTSSATTTKIGTSTGWVQIFAQGNTSITTFGSIQSPDGHGWLLDNTSLENQTILAGNWQWTEKSRISIGTATIDMVVRYYKRSSGAVYTLIASITLSAQSYTNTGTTYTSASTSESSMAFIVGDKLYKDIWYNVTTNNSGSATATLSNQSCNNVGAGLTGIGQATTPGYRPTPRLICDGMGGVFS